jgi:hypothetical protein
MLAVTQLYIALGDTINETASLIPFPCKAEEYLKTYDLFIYRDIITLYD